MRRQVARGDARLDVGRASSGIVHDYGDNPPGELLSKRGVSDDTR